jgi:hypothetical protein
VRAYFMEQGSSEWWERRKGIPTCSNFDRIITGTGKLSKQADDYICELIGDKYSLIPPEGVENYTSRAIRWGQQTEADACRWYEMETGSVVTRVGFLVSDDGYFGGSPDRVIGPLEDHEPARIVGGAEVKCPQAAAHVRYCLDGIVPTKYKPQVHGYLWLAKADWWDFVSFCPGLPGLRIRCEPDEYTKSLGQAMLDFRDRYREIERKLELTGEIPA